MKNNVASKKKIVGLEVGSTSPMGKKERKERKEKNMTKHKRG